MDGFGRAFGIRDGLNRIDHNCRDKRISFITFRFILMEIYCRNTIAGLVPIYASDLEEKKRLKIGENYLCQIRKPRNYQFHKKFFALLNIGWENTPEVDMPFETYRRWVTMRAGFYKVYHTPKGELYEPRSIAFSAMDEDSFEEVYNRVLDVILKDTGADKPDVEAMLVEFM